VTGTRAVLQDPPHHLATCCLHISASYDELVCHMT